MVEIVPQRRFSSRTRQHGFRDAKLIIIAAEGTKTEKKYFDDLAYDPKYRNPKVHVETLDRKATASSPKHIIAELDKFRRTYRLNKDDELWLVIDLDSWPDSTLGDVATQCIQKAYSLAVSNPCFEIWLLLHFTTLDKYTSDELVEFTENKKSGNRNRIEKEIIKFCGSYNKSDLNTANYIPKVEEAVENAKKIDVNPEHRWPNQIGTRVYLLVEKIIQSSHR